MRDNPNFTSNESPTFLGLLLEVQDSLDVEEWTMKEFTAGSSM